MSSMTKQGSAYIIALGLCVAVGIGLVGSGRYYQAQFPQENRPYAVCCHYEENTTVCGDGAIEANCKSGGGVFYDKTSCKNTPCDGAEATAPPAPPAELERE